MERDIADPPKRKRRWFQFSLRSPSTFTMVVAVGSGWLGRKIERKRKERDAVAALLHELLECALCADFASRCFSS